MLRFIYFTVCTSYLNVLKVPKLKGRVNQLIYGILCNSCLFSVQHWLNPEEGWTLQKCNSQKGKAPGSGRKEGSHAPVSQRTRGKGTAREIKIAKKTGHFVLQLKVAKIGFMALLGMFNNSKRHSPWNMRGTAQGKCCPSTLQPSMGTIHFLAAARRARPEKLLALWFTVNCAPA